MNKKELAIAIIIGLATALLLEWAIVNAFTNNLWY